MRIDIGFVAEVAWMPRLYDTRLRDHFEDGEQVSLESVERGRRGLLQRGRRDGRAAAVGGGVLRGLQ